MNAQGAGAVRILWRNLLTYACELGTIMHRNVDVPLLQRNAAYTPSLIYILPIYEQYIYGLLLKTKLGPQKFSK